MHVGFLVCDRVPEGLAVTPPVAEGEGLPLGVCTTVQLSDHSSVKLSEKDSVRLAVRAR